jgi:predicted ATPase
MHIAIVGNIGAGKTTLTEMLAKNYGWDPLYEAVDNAGALTCRSISSTAVTARSSKFKKADATFFRTEPFMRMPTFLQRTCTIWA